jgi:hypothetical protein
MDSMPAQLVSQIPQTGAPAAKPAMQRKQSSPMMPPFMVSAPGKVIVYGEHAVVHGKVGHDPPAFTKERVLTLITACHRGRHFSPLVPPRLIPLQVAPNRHDPLSRHRTRTHLEHRRAAVGRLQCAWEEEALLRPSNVPRPRADGSTATALRRSIAQDP